MKGEKRKGKKNNWVKEKLILKMTSANVTLGHGGDSGERRKKRGIIHSVFCGFLLKTKTFNHISFEYLREEEIFCELFLSFFSLSGIFRFPFLRETKVIFVGEKNSRREKIPSGGNNLSIFSLRLLPRFLCKDRNSKFA